MFFKGVAFNRSTMFHPPPHPGVYIQTALIVLAEFEGGGENTKLDGYEMAVGECRRGGRRCEYNQNITYGIIKE